jgi:sigma-B regulation protein RsbU (phosphoserine phosphatase)
LYASAVFAVLDAERRTIRASRAGHPPPLLSRSRTVEALPVEPALALLFDELGDVPCSEHSLGRGDRILFYTDGVTDRRAPDDSMFEDESLAAALASLDTLPPAEIREHLVARLDAFASGIEPDDDQTLLLVAID